jgi:imidazolonepropionase-like amidohydrolase
MIAVLLVITHVTVVDVRAGTLQPDVDVVIRDERIAKIGKGASEPGATVVEGRGKFLVPGFWDMHVHLSWARASALPSLVANGVTGVRDLGGKLAELDDWRARIAAGALVGPRIVRVGPILNGKSFNPLQLVPGGVGETRGVIRALHHVGVDAIKVHRRMPRDWYFAAVDEAKRQGLPLVGHIPMEVTPEEASDAGQATVEHTETLFEGTFSAKLKEDELPGAIERFVSSGAADRLFARFVKNGTVCTPTIATFEATVRALDPSAAPDPLQRYVARSLRKVEKSSDVSGMKRMFTALLEVVRQAHRSGVMLLAGSDLAGPRIPGFTLHDEMTTLVRAGLTPLEALRTATLNPAIVLGRTRDLGTVEAGKLADLVLLDGNPLERIENTRRISAVVAQGRLHRRDALDALLRDGERLANDN